MEMEALTHFTVHLHTLLYSGKNWQPDLCMWNPFQLSETRCACLFNSLLSGCRKSVFLTPRISKHQSSVSQICQRMCCFGGLWCVHDALGGYLLILTRQLGKCSILFLNFQMPSWRRRAEPQWQTSRIKKERRSEIKKGKRGGGGMGGCSGLLCVWPDAQGPDRLLFFYSVGNQLLLYRSISLHWGHRGCDGRINEMK